MNHYIVCCQRRLKKYSATPPCLQKQQKIVGDVENWEWCSFRKGGGNYTFCSWQDIYPWSRHGVKITGEMATINTNLIPFVKSFLNSYGTIFNKTSIVQKFSQCRRTRGTHGIAQGHCSAGCNNSGRSTPRHWRSGSEWQPLGLLGSNELMIPRAC